MKNEYYPFVIEDIFKIQSGSRLTNKQKKAGLTPFVGATNNSNGVTGFVSNINQSLDNNVLGVNYNGSPCEAFYHQNNTLFSDDVKRFHFKESSDSKEKYLFVATSIKKQRENFSHGHKADTNRLKRLNIMLPAKNGQPDYSYMEQYIRDKYNDKKSKYINYLETQLSILGTYKELISLEDKNWNEFKFIDIFDIKGGFYNKKPKASKDGTIPFLGASENNNGVTQFLTIDSIKKSSKTGKLPNESFDKKIFDGNCIAITNNGSVGHAYYQPHAFTCSHDITCVYLKEDKLNKYIALFLINSIQYSGRTFQFARKWRPKRMKHSKLMLPINKNGKPDWQYMEQYSKNMIIKKYTQYLNFINAKGIDNNE